jgi:transcriptional regulator with PAS, ATPase and Fis domain
MDPEGAAAGSGSLLDDVERKAILEALDSSGHNRRKTAEKLGISKRTLQYRLKRYGLAGRK